MPMRGEVLTVSHASPAAYSSFQAAVDLEHGPCRSDNYAAVSARMHASRGSVQKLVGSRGDFDSYIWPADGFEPLTEAGTKRPVVNCAANLQHQVGASPRPAHLLRLVHPTIDQEIRRALRHCCPDAHAGAVSSGVVDKPGALAAEIFVDLVKRMPQSSGCHCHAAANSALLQSRCKFYPCNGSIRARSRSTPARPYMARLSVFNLLI